MNKQTEKGNAIIWILIAVGLFAALGYAFSSTSRNSVSTLTDTEAEAYAYQIIAYGNEVKSAIKRMSLRGCSDFEFSFENTIFKFNNGNNINDIGHNPNNTKDSCKLYHAKGGGLSPKLISNKALTPSSAGSAPEEGAWVPWEGALNNIGTSENELFYIAPYISQKVCSEINKILSVANGTIPDASGSIERYNGDFTAGNWAIEAEFENHLQFCYQLPAFPGVYNYLHTVLIR